MTHHIMKHAALSALAVAALGWAASAQAAGTDYLLKLGGVDGESKDEAQAADKDHKGWILLDSVQLGAERASGGVNVASGDVNGVKSPRDAASGQATGKRTHAPVRTRTHHAVDPSAGPGNISAADPDPATTALLLPAVQKVREAAMRTPAWAGCAAGQKIEALAIKQKSTGRMGRILDATVSSCATESVSFNFTKIEWN